MHLPLSSWIIIAVALLLVFASGVWKWLRQRARAGGERRAAGRTMPSAFSGTGTPLVPPVPEPQGRLDRRAAEIDEVSILDEIDIYLAYGHLEQAATTLRWYVDHHPEDSVQAGRLLDLYLELLDIDHLTELLERALENCSLSRDQAVTLALAGLEKDPDNLTLRVFADTQLGMGREIVDAELGRRNSQKTPAMPILVVDSPGFAEIQRELQQVIVNPEPVDFSGIHLDAFRRERSPIRSSPAPVKDACALVQGSVPAMPVTPVEQTIISTLVSPSLALQLLQEAGQFDEAAILLNRQTILHPEQPGLHVALLRILHARQEKDQYGRALLSLYITLWGMGKALRQRLLSLGRQMGDSPLWDELAGAEGNENQLGAIAERHGHHIPASAIPASSPPLVEEQLRHDHMVANTEAGDQVLQEFNMLLDYGQVDEAVGLLEQAALASPQRNNYFFPLMEMYERMQAQERFARFIRKILASETPPDESILRQMFHLSERLRPAGQQPV